MPPAAPEPRKPTLRDHARRETSVLLRRFAFQITRAARFGDPDAIHDLRVSIRRLRSCLRMFHAFYPPGHAKKIRAQLAALMNSAAQVRDRDIAIGLLAEAGVPKSAALVERLQAERREASLDLLFEIRRWKNRDFSKKWRSRLEL
jgi:CHAD domain-containing protein